MVDFNESDTCISKSSLVSKLLVKLKELSKKPPQHSHLSQILDSYVNQLNKSQHLMSYGIFDVNFAEAGLFLESCSVYYGRNVDFLLDFLLDCQKRICLYEKKSEKTVKANLLFEEQLNKYKRKKRKEVVVEKVQEDVSNIDSILKEIDEGASIESFQQELLKVWKTSQSGLPSVDNSSLSDSISNADVRHRLCRDICVAGELLCRYEDLHMNSCLESYNVSKMIFDLHYLNRDLSGARNRTDCDLVLQKYLAENNLSLVDMHDKELWANFKEYCNIERLADKCKRLCPKSFVIPITRLGEGVIKPYLDKYTQSSMEENNNNNCKISLRSDSGFYEMTDSQDFDFENTFLTESTSCVESDLSKRLEPNSQTTHATTHCSTNDEIHENSLNTTSNNLEFIPTSSQCSSPLTTNSSFAALETVPSTLKETPKKIRKRLNSTEAEEQLKSKRKRKVKDVWLKTTSAPLMNFEAFYRKEYVTSENEGCAFTSTLEESVEDDTVEDSTPFDSVAISSPQPDSSIEQPATPEDSLLTLQKTQRSNLNTWKNFIEDKLQQSDQRADFDIHEYGTEIIDRVSDVGVIKFKDIVSGKTSAQVSRYFIASLQLANTYNIELLEPPAACLANDHLQFKFLSRERYHESLDDYQAPSEESFRENIIKAQAINRHQLYSTPSTSSTEHKHKRRRVDK